MSDNQVDDVLGDDECSPECLLTFEPVKDPYSTDEEKDSCRKDETKESALSTLFKGTQTIVSYSGSEVTVQQLKHFFKLKFYSLPKGPGFEEMQNLDISEIMDYIAQFVTSTNDLTSKMIIDSMKDFKQTPLDMLFTDKDFHIDFKKRETLLPDYARPLHYNYHMAYVFLRKMAEALYLTRNPNPIDTKYHHATVKGCMLQFFQLSYQEVVANGACIYELESTVISRRSGKESTVRFTPRPDLLIKTPDSDTCPGIPIQVYSPIKKEEKKITLPSLKSKAKKVMESHDPTSGNESFITDEDSVKPLSQFLSENVPLYMCEKSKRCESKFKGKLVAQHVLQIISMASQSSYSKWRKNDKMLKAQVFIGLFVCDEFVYITKIQGDESSLVKYSTEYIRDKTTRIVNRRDLLTGWLWGNVRDGDADNSDSDPNIHVQFSPVVFDMSIHNHRMALILFISYYMDNKAQVKYFDLRKQCSSPHLKK